MGTPAGAVVSQFLKRLPAFSPVAVRLMALVADENVSFKEVAKLISLDPALSGETLRMANSGLFWAAPGGSVGVARDRHGGARTG